uniref:Histone PARylation factor 1 n=1 Tax=Mus musculus TaxID=10090 RepID=D6RFB7_MOUSE
MVGGGGKRRTAGAGPQLTLRESARQLSTLQATRRD